MIQSELSKDQFLATLDRSINLLFSLNDEIERAEMYTGMMNYARQFELAAEVEQEIQGRAKQKHVPELWELPESFEKPVELQGFPISALPSVLSDYLQEVARTVQVFPEMCALPLLSTLSLCIMGKACIQFPGNDYREPMNLYTVTVAAPGQRKSSSYSNFTAPVDSYVKRYNAIHSVDIQSNKAERAAKKQQIEKEIRSKSPDMDKIRQLNQELDSMDKLNELRMNVKDATPEALAWEMYLQNERIGILDDEGGVFDVLGGLYSNGQSNIGIFLEAFDGSPYSIIRRTKENITLYCPLLTMGLMTQPSHFDEIMSNRQFLGRGLMHRFLFSFPGSKAGHQTLNTGNINSTIKSRYIQLINKLLETPYPEPGEETPVIMCDSGAQTVLTDYHDMLQKKIQPGGMFENMVEWAAKHFARCMRIAGILHFCEHSTSEELNEQTAINAIDIAMWAENHALKALSGEMSDTQEEKDAKYILSKLKKSGKDVITKRELLRMCSTLSTEETDYPLEILEDMKCIKRELIKTGKPGKPKELIKINPLIY